MRVANGFIYFMIIGTIVISVVMKKTPRVQFLRRLVREHYLLFIILFVANSISFACSFIEDSKEVVVRRNDIFGSEKTISIILEKENEQYPFQMQLKQVQLTPDDINQKMNEAFQFLEKNMKGENSDLDNVKKNLDFNLDEKNYPFDLEIIPDQYLLMDEDGKIRNSEEEIRAAGYTKAQAEKGIETGLTVVLYYGEKEEERHFDFVLYPKELTAKERLFLDVKKTIENKEAETAFEQELQLPAVVNGVTVSCEKNIATNPLFVLGMGVVLCGLVLLRNKERQVTQKKKREEALRKSYPGFVNEMVLLLGAGMQVRNIFELLIREYEIDCKQRQMKYKPKGKKQQQEEPLIQELRIAKQNFEMGMAEEKVYYQLGRRLKLSCYIKIMSLLEQNVKKGSKGLAVYFEQEVQNAFEEQKQLAKRFGEEAGTKLLGPMMLQLFVVMFVIMIPAFMSF